MDDKKMLLSFKGNKKEIQEQFKIACKNAGETMNCKIIKLIEQFLKEQRNEKIVTRISK